jgi:hypothetical protein
MFLVMVTVIVTVTAIVTVLVTLRSRCNITSRLHDSNVNFTVFLQILFNNY